jgi:hypothetical protein
MVVTAIMSICERGDELIIPIPWVGSRTAGFRGPTYTVPLTVLQRSDGVPDAGHRGCTSPTRSKQRLSSVRKGGRSFDNAEDSRDSARVCQGQFFTSPTAD